MQRVAKGEKEENNNKLYACSPPPCQTKKDVLLFPGDRIKQRLSILYPTVPNLNARRSGKAEEEEEIASQYPLSP